MNKNTQKVPRGPRHDFTLIALLLIPIGVALNFVCAQIVTLLRLPIFLDTSGTAIVSMIGGPWVGIATGVATNFTKGIFNPVSFAFAPVSAMVALAVGLLSMSGFLTRLWKVVIAGVLVAVVTTCCIAPIQVLLLGGASGHSSDILVATLLASGQQIWASVISTKIITESIDKVLSLTIAFLIVRKMSERYLVKLNYGAVYADPKKMQRSPSRIVRDLTALRLRTKAVS